MNWMLEKLQEDLKQSKYNLNKQGLYVGRIKKNVEDLLQVLKEEEQNSKEIENKNKKD